jgi:hypothetical protein
MGCDIHLLIEYDVAERWEHAMPDRRRPPCTPEPFTSSNCMRAFADGQFFIPRDYRLFAALAGVRRDGDEPLPLVAPRGYPDIASGDADDVFFQYVRDEDERPLMDIREATRAEAEAYVARGRSFYRDLPGRPRKWVSNPDWHTPSWLFTAEIRPALRVFGLEPMDCSVEFDIVCGTCAALERFYGPNRARILFWFDN